MVTEESILATDFLSQVCAPWVMLDNRSEDYNVEELIRDFTQGQSHFITTESFHCAPSFFQALKEFKHYHRQTGFVNNHVMVLFYKIMAPGNYGDVAAEIGQGDTDLHPKLHGFASKSTSFVYLESIPGKDLITYRCCHDPDYWEWCRQHPKLFHFLLALIQVIKELPKIEDFYITDKYSDIASSIQTSTKAPAAAKKTDCRMNLLIRMAYNPRRHQPIGSNCKWSIVEVDYKMKGKKDSDLHSMMDINKSEDKWLEREEWILPSDNLSHQQLQRITALLALPIKKEEKDLKILTDKWVEIDADGDNEPLLNEESNQRIVSILDLFVPGPLDAIFASLTAIYDVGEAAYKIAKSAKPYIMASSRQGSGGLISRAKDLLVNQAMKKQIKSWDQEFNASANPQWTKAQRDKAENDFLAQKVIRSSKKLKPDARSSIMKIRGLSIENLQLLGKPVLMDLYMANILSPEQKNQVMLHNIISQSDLNSYQPYITGVDKDYIKKLLKDLKVMSSKEREKYGYSQGLDTDIFRGSDSYLDGNSSLIGVAVIDDVSAVAVIGIGVALVCTAVVVVMGVISATAVVTGAIGAKLLPYVLARWSRGAGGFGDTLRETARDIKTGAQQKFLKYFAGLTPQQADAKIANSVIERSKKMSPDQAIYTIQNMSNELLQSLPKEVLENLVKRNVLSHRQVDLLIKSKTIPKSYLVETIYDTSYVLHLQKLSRRELLGLPRETIKLFIQAGILTLPQVKFLLDQNKIAQGDIRNSKYQKADLEKADSLNDTVPAGKFNTNVGILAVAIQESAINMKQLETLTPGQIKFFIKAHTFPESQAKYLLSKKLVTIPQLTEGAYDFGALKAAPIYANNKPNPKLDELIHVLGGELSS